MTALRPSTGARFRQSPDSFAAMHSQKCFWTISLFLLSFSIPGMASLDLENCMRWHRELSDPPTYNCSIFENSTIRFPIIPDNWTRVFWQANSSSTEVPVLSFNNGAPKPLNRKFQGCTISDGYIYFNNLTESQQGVYVVKVKEVIIACYNIRVLPAVTSSFDVSSPVIANVTETPEAAQPGTYENVPWFAGLVVIGILIAVGIPLTLVFFLIVRKRKSKCRPKQATSAVDSEQLMNGSVHHQQQESTTV